MQNNKHYSFDLWFTLIKSNPHFKKERARHFFKYYNSKFKTLEEVESVFRRVDLMCNSINEKTGGNIRSEEMYLMVVYQLNDSLDAIKKLDTATIYRETERLIFSYMPTVFNSETYICLDKLKQNPAHTLNILSNTAFIKGKTLKKILDFLDLSSYFDFQIYSDEVGMSKPNPKLYQILLENIYETRKNKIELHEIIHIGDNPVADISGAEAIGINTFQINTNDKLITHLFD